MTDRPVSVLVDLFLDLTHSFIGLSHVPLKLLNFVIVLLQ